MSYFKKFGDFCSGFTCFIILIYLFRTFMKLKPTEEEVGLVGKLKEFLSVESAYDKRLAAVLVIMLVLSVAAGMLFKKLPYICAVFSLPPLLLAVDMVKSEYIKDYPVLCLLLLGIAFVACVFECVRLDRADGRRRTCLCGALISGGLAAYLWWLYDKAQRLLAAEALEVEVEEIAKQTAELGEKVDKFARFNSEILFGAEDMNIKILAVLASVYAVLALVGLLLRDIYFVDAVLVLPPTVALIYFWSAEKITFHEEVMVTFAVAVLAARIIPAFSGCARTRGTR